MPNILRVAPGELLRREGFRWKRTRDSVRHKPDPALQQAARTQLVRVATGGHPQSPGQRTVVLDSPQHSQTSVEALGEANAQEMTREGDSLLTFTSPDRGVHHLPGDTAARQPGRDRSDHREYVG
ncbi:hypothetical protein ACH4SP_02235 [Streptomyces sp. NPDC021093]|uniref:hypothetical protein n=1 Tax=Streptomyces sp. NPDC021093 TaxID=3365112 RepID=UPI0037A183EF